MKVSAHPFVYSGTCDGLVYYYNRLLGTMIARRYVIPRASSATANFRDISRNMKALAISEGYKRDLNSYVAFASFSERGKKLVNWRCVLNKIMFAMAKAMPEIDLKSITRNQIIENNLPCKTVYRAVQAGYLEDVAGCENLVQVI